MDLQDVLRGRPEDGRHARKNQYIRFETACQVGFLLGVLRAHEEEPYLKGFDSLPPARKAAIALSEGYAMECVLQTMAPPNGEGDEVCSGLVMMAVPECTSELWRHAWRWLSEQADKDEALGKRITGILSGRETLDSVREYFCPAGEAQTTDR